VNRSAPSSSSFAGKSVGSSAGVNASDEPTIASHFEQEFRKQATFLRAYTEAKIAEFQAEAVRVRQTIIESREAQSKNDRDDDDDDDDDE
jgi:hypothetical protein